MLHTAPFAGTAAAVNLMQSVGAYQPDGQQRHAGITRAKDGFAIIKIANLILPDGSPDRLPPWATSLEWLRVQLRHAIGNFPGVYLWFADTNGGPLLGVPETAKVIRHARGIKPVYGLAHGILGGPAVALAANCSKVFVTPSTAIGAIGVSLFHIDQSERLKKLGLQATSIKFGKHKADGNNVEPLTAQGRETLQQYVDSYGRQMVAEICYGRSLQPSVVMEQFGHGRLFIAAEAKQRGMVDEIGDLDLLTR